MTRDQFFDFLQNLSSDYADGLITSDEFAAKVLDALQVLGATPSSTDIAYDNAII